jgi:peptide deformylase
MILKLVESDASILLQKTPVFDLTDPPTDPIELAKDLYETMIEHKGLSLSAPQVGLPYRAFALFAVPGIVVFNPYIIDQTGEQIVMDEASVTFPNLILPIKRPRRIKVRYREPNGNPMTRVLDGMSARCFLQQVDHLNGILYTRHANKIHLDRAMRKKKQSDRQQKREEKDLV